MEVEDILFNDNLAQFYKSYHLSKENQEKRKKEVNSCNHLFVLTDNLEVECIYCGLSNRTLNVYFKFLEYLDTTNYQKFFKELPFEGKLFLDSYPNCLANFNLSNFNLITKEILRTWHASVLYQVAKELDDTSDLETTFQIMQDLNALEMDFERIKIAKKFDAYELMKRYEANFLKSKSYRK